MEAAKVRLLAPEATVLTSDFFDLEPSTIGRVAAVIGNPPYIRYHEFSGTDREKGLRRARAQGVDLTNLASSWAHFVAHAVSFLGPDGRLALVLPAELLHADYAQPVRDLLLRRFSSVVIVAFDRAVFANAQVDAVLLLASDDDHRGLRVIRVGDARDLQDLDVVASAGPVATPRRWSSAVDGSAGAIYEELARTGRVIPVGALASVDIGFVSGANDFFVLTTAIAEQRRLPAAVLTPAVRRPTDVPGLRARGGEIRLLLDLARRDLPSSRSLAAYIQEGEETGVANGYKCRTRKPWYAVPLPRSKPDAFLPYMVHRAPRLIVNDIDGWSSNLLHGVTLGLLAPPVEALAVAMASSITLLSAEIEGRAYGGGVLKLETKEAERLLVPRLTSEEVARLAAIFTNIDELVSAGELEAAARVVDRTLGFDHDALWGAHVTLRDRRLGRRRKHAA